MFKKAETRSCVQLWNTLKTTEKTKIKMRKFSQKGCGSFRIGEPHFSTRKCLLTNKDEWRS